MMVNNASPLWRIVSVNSSCSAVRLVSSSRLVMPITAFMGVRISWLIVARNTLLAWLADSAASLACCMASNKRAVSIAPLICPVMVSASFTSSSEKATDFSSRSTPIVPNTSPRATIGMIISERAWRARNRSWIFSVRGLVCASAILMGCMVWMTRMEERLPSKGMKIPRSVCALGSRC